jgi:hypothetical protein
MSEDSFNERLDGIAKAWQRQRYSGPAPAFEAPAEEHRLAWWGAFALAVLVAVLLWPGAPEWPESLRPVLRGSSLAAQAPAPTAAPVAFRLPSAPQRQSCFSPTGPCDQPTG